MTADVEILPELVDEGLDFFNLAGDEGDKLYVRAIRQHIAAKDAEIEALRAEVGETKEVAVRAMRQRDAQYNRAERLAEALRAEIPVLRRIAGFGNMSDEMTEEVADRLESALNLATQENDDA